MGGQQKGRAAVYDLPHRHGKSIPKWKRQGDPNLEGSWRVHCGRLRPLASKLSSNEMKAFLKLQAVNRRENGEPALNRGTPAGRGSKSAYFG